MALQDLDDIYSYVGSFGRFQAKLQVFLSLMKIPQTSMVLIMYFAALNPPQMLSKNYAGNDTPHLNETINDICSLPREMREYTEHRDYSIVTRYDLACGKEWYIDLSTSAIFIGRVLGSLIFGYLGDHYGRKIVLLSTFTGILVVSAASKLLPFAEMFLVSRLFVGAFIAGTVMTQYVLASEFVGVKYRPVVTVQLFMMTPVTDALLGGLAYVIRDWRYLFLACTLPYIPMLFLWRWVPESYRWLHAQGRSEEALDLVKRIARANKKEIPQSPEAPVETYNQETTTVSSTKAASTGALSNFKNRRVIFMTLSFGIGMAAVTTGTNGMVLAAGKFQGLDIYQNFVLTSLSGIPAGILAMLGCRKVGRKPTVLIPLAIAGIFTICTPFIPSNTSLVYLRLTCGIIGKLLFTLANMAIYTWSVEVYPTSIRAFSVGFLQVWAQIGGAASPWIVNSLVVFNPYVPFVVMGSGAIVASFLMMHLPETKDATENELMEVFSNEKEEPNNFDSLVMKSGAIIASLLKMHLPETKDTVKRE